MDVFNLTSQLLLLRTTASRTATSQLGPPLTLGPPPTLGPPLTLCLPHRRRALMLGPPLTLGPTLTLNTDLTGIRGMSH
ncbi:unnamed protein product [Arctogadus glacialis]